MGWEDIMINCERDQGFPNQFTAHAVSIQVKQWAKLKAYFKAWSGYSAWSGVFTLRKFFLAIGG